MSDRMVKGIVLFVIAVLTGLLIFIVMAVREHNNHEENFRVACGKAGGMLVGQQPGRCFTQGSELFPEIK